MGSISDAAKSGSTRDVLVAMRDKIAHDLDNDVQARDLASLTKRLMEITREIELIDAADEGDDVSDAAATADEAWAPTDS